MLSPDLQVHAYDGSVQLLLVAHSDFAEAPEAKTSEAPAEGERESGGQELGTGSMQSTRLWQVTTFNTLLQALVASKFFTQKLLL